MSNENENTSKSYMSLSNKQNLDKINQTLVADADKFGAMYSVYI